MPNTNKQSDTTSAANDNVVEPIDHPAIPFPTSDNPPLQAEKVEEKVSEAIKPVGEKLAALKQEASSKLSSGAIQAVSKLGEHSENLYAAQAKLLDACRHQVRKQPMTMLGIAIATVVTVGVLLRRQTR